MIVEPSSVFVNLLRRTPRHRSPQVAENFFTECLAAALQEDALFRQRFVGRLLEGRPRERRRRRVLGLSTQRSHYGRTQARRRSQIDLEFQLDSGKAIGVEIKLTAPEGTSSDGTRKLITYTRLPSLHRIAFITGYHAKGEFKSLGHKYLIPANGRGHFLWSDFHDLLLDGAQRAAAPALHRALLGLFRYLNFEPVHPDIGDLHDYRPQVRVRNQERFRQLYGPLQAGLKAAGVVHEPPRKNGDMFTFNLKHKAWKIMIDARHVPGSLRLWCNFHSRKQRDEVRHLLERRRPTDRILLLPVAKSTWPALDVRIPYSWLFPRASNETTKSVRLAQQILPLILRMR